MSPAWSKPSGRSVTRFKPGDEVFADLFGNDGGTFAEFVSAPEKKFELMPAGMSFEDASTLPHSAILALQGLRLRKGRTPKPGDKVLINGASGNVGPFAVQIAKWMGAEVTGACRTSKVDFVRSLGADHVIDYTQVDYTTAGERYDWILDTDSHQSIRRARRALRPNGVYVTLGGTPDRSSRRCCWVRCCRSPATATRDSCCGGSRSTRPTWTSSRS